MKSLTILILLLFISCANNSKIERVDSKEPKFITIRWDSNDLQEIAYRATNSILTSSTIDFSKSYGFGKIRNDSHDHIDVKALVDKIIVGLKQSGKVRVSNKRESGIFLGKISSIFKKTEESKDMFFNFNLTLVDTQTANVIWSKDIEIRKVYNKALFGW